MRTIKTYPSDFEAWYKILKPSEGGLSDRPLGEDPAGLTNRGITIATFKRVAMPILGIAPTETNLRALTADQSKEIAYIEYWVNKGVPSALPQYRTILADSLFLGGGLPSLGYTGKKDSKGKNIYLYANISELNKAKPEISAIASRRLAYLKTLKNWEANKHGWSTRLQNIVGKSVKFTSENLGSSIIVLIVLGSLFYLSFKPK